jgi:hypothetical protein
MTVIARSRIPKQSSRGEAEIASMKRAARDDDDFIFSLRLHGTVLLRGVVSRSNLLGGEEEIASPERVVRDDDDFVYSLRPQVTLSF